MRRTFLIEKLKDLREQALAEHSHYYTANLLKDTIAFLKNEGQHQTVVIPEIAEEIDEFIQELKDDTTNSNSIIFGINGHKILALMEIKKRLAELKTKNRNYRNDERRIGSMNNLIKEN
uniref:Uncharacterized protein n=1 Tax=viral metagenome TaxID=1070528 RepID=A0A6H1ZSC2_9ZZZZ